MNSYSLSSPQCGFSLGMNTHPKVSEGAHLGTVCFEYFQKRAYKGCDISDVTTTTSFFARAEETKSNQSYHPDRSHAHAHFRPHFFSFLNTSRSLPSLSPFPPLPFHPPVQRSLSFYFLPRLLPTFVLAGPLPTSPRSVATSVS